MWSLPCTPLPRARWWRWTALPSPHWRISRRVTRWQSSPLRTARTSSSTASPSVTPPQTPPPAPGCTPTTCTPTCPARWSTAITPPRIWLRCLRSSRRPLWASAARTVHLLLGQVCQPRKGRAAVAHPHQSTRAGLWLSERGRPYLSSASRYGSGSNSSTVCTPLVVHLPVSSIRAPHIAGTPVV